MERHSQILGVTIVALFLLSLMLPLPWRSVAVSPDSEELEYYTDYICSSLEQKGVDITPEQAEEVVRRAYRAAAHFGDSRAQCASYRERFLEAYVQAAGEDVVIIYNSGGLGRTSVEKDTQWGEVVKHMKTMLEESGHSTVILDYTRTMDGVIHSLIELRDFINAYPVKSKWLSAEIEFVLQNTSHTKIILTGVSQGAAYANEVMRRLQGDPLAAQRVICVEAGVPFYYKAGIAPGQILELYNNGTGEDPMVSGDLERLTSTFALATLKWAMSYLEGISLDPTDCWNNPGHNYYWVYPGVGHPITAFLEQHFANT